MNKSNLIKSFLRFQGMILLYLRFVFNVDKYNLYIEIFFLIYIEFVLNHIKEFMYFIDCGFEWSEPGIWQF